MSENIKAVVFDSDGTLIDTRELIIQGFKTVLKQHGLEHLANDHYIRQRLGKPVPETYEQIIAGHNTNLSIEDLIHEHDKAQNSMTHLIQAYPHTKDILEKWRSHDIRLCLFTSGNHMMIQRNFAAAGIDNVYEIFHAIVTADEPISRKPEPDAILSLLDQVNVQPKNAVVVGDHAYDIIAGKRAHVGLKVGILHGFGTQHELLNSGADFLCDNLGSLDRLMSFAS